MASITRVVPISRTISLGGRTFTVWPGRLIEIAQIQAWIDIQWGSPLDDLVSSGVLELDENDSRRIEQVSKAKDRASIGPPLFDEPEGSAMLATAEGVVAFVSIALRRGNPDLSVADIVNACCSMTASEFANLRMIFYSMNQCDQVLKIGVKNKESQKGKISGTDWTKIIDTVSKDRRLSYSDVYNMTLAEIDCIISEGEISAFSFSAHGQGRPMTQEEYDNMVLSMTGRLPEQLWGNKSKDT